jgi:hypothetical protein
MGNTFPTAWLAEEENVRVLLMVESSFLVEERLGRLCERIGFEQPVITLLWITLLKRLSLRLCSFIFEGKNEQRWRTTQKFKRIRSEASDNDKLVSQRVSESSSNSDHVLIASARQCDHDNLILWKRLR